MSPRRQVDPADRDYFVPQSRRPVRWRFPLVTALTALVAAAAVAAGVFMVVSYESYHSTQVRDAAALDYVGEFMTDYTTLDPFHANNYADGILAEGTGDFATQFKEKMNEIVVQVARAEPTKGTVLAKGVQRWNDDGSADVLVAAKITTTSPDKKSTIDSGSRWMVTTIKEGQQWKISKLIQVI